MSKQTNGSPRIIQELMAQGIEVSQSAEARIRRSKGLMARPRCKFVHTTDSNHGYRVADNKLSRNFTAERINEKWFS